MRNLVRTAVSGAAAIAVVATTTLPAQAYFRQVVDRRGDVALHGSCAGKPRVRSLDIKEVDVWTDPVYDRTEVSVGIKLAGRLPKPGAERQVIKWSFETTDGGSMYLLLERYTYHGKTTTTAMVDGRAGAYRHAEIHGKTIEVDDVAQIWSDAQWYVRATTRYSNGRCSATDKTSPWRTVHT